jgi:TetR/AcrR family transcriptional regulator
MANKKSHPAPDLSAEQRIRAAALKEFSERGIEGARMQAIADRAGVNKALLHYYFRSKDKLFEIIIRDIAESIWRNIRVSLEERPQNLDLRSVVRLLVSSFINAFSQQPEIPRILIRQMLNKDKNVPVIAGNIIKAVGTAPKRILSLLDKEIRARRIKNVDRIQLMMNIMGMILATFLSQPVAEIVKQITGLGIVYDRKFYETRIDFITDMVFDGILVKEHAS